MAILQGLHATKSNNRGGKKTQVPFWNYSLDTHVKFVPFLAHYVPTSLRGSREQY